MDKTTYITKTGLKQFRPVLSAAQFERATNDNRGFCLACGSTQGSCEPDARKYKCKNCGKEKVYGFEELNLMNLISFK